MSRNIISVLMYHRHKLQILFSYTITRSVFVCWMFNDAVNISDYTAQNCMIIT
jgi:hypothetical protein